ncbi:MAG: amino acid permease [Deltaproteobacteria bacterium]|nr:amino acid permease [Candidatus Zymogenaceae bacterium]
MKDEGILGLKRVLGLPEVVGIEVGQTVGAGVFAMTGIAIGICGAALPIAYALAVIPVAFFMLPIAVLGSAIPTVGGNYTYPSRLFSPTAAFMGLWIYAIGAFLGFFPLYAVTLVEYLKHFFPGISVPLFSALVLTFFYVVNIFGVRFAARIQGLMVLVMIGALIMYTVQGIPHIEAVNFTVIAPKGTLSIISAAALLTFPYMGANAVIELGGEIKKPERTIPISFLIAIPLVAVIYIAMSFVAVGVTGWEACANKSLIESARAFLSAGALNFFIIGGAILALSTTLNATFMWGTKSLMIVGKDGLLPRALTRVNPRFGTPIGMLTLIWALSVAAVLSGVPIKSFAIYSSIGGLVIFVPVMIASVLLKKKMPEAWKASKFKVSPRILIACVVIGILFFAVATAALFMELWNSDRFMFWFFFVLIAVGIAYHFTMKRRSGKTKAGPGTAPFEMP